MMGNEYEYIRLDCDFFRKNPKIIKARKEDF